VNDRLSGLSFAQRGSLEKHCCMDFNDHLAGVLDGGSMNIPEDVINGLTIPTPKFVYHSEWLAAAALTQTYAYMIENGLDYSKLITGEVDVFLQVTEDEPYTLYYHLAEPNIEADAHSEVDILLCCTTVGQTLA
jgi:hypothetical protein